MLMAAGLGTRLRPFTDREPKALFPVLGVPVAQFAVDALARAGVRKIVANIHHHPDRAAEGLRAIDRGEIELELSDERELLLGSAGGIRKALPRFEVEPFFLLNSDVLCDIDLEALARRHEALRKSYGVAMTLAIFAESPSSGKYREIHLDLESGLVRGFGELTNGRPFFVGAAVLEAEALANVPPSGPAEFVPTILEPMIRARKAGFFLTQGIWKDIGAPELWLEAQLFLIRALETGHLPQSWRRRLEHRNRRAASEIWLGRGRASVVDWAEPCYWDGVGRAPRSLGPRAVLYGELPRAPVGPGIGFHGLWVDCPQLSE
jgi:NDP-sugar pyrophosphorylase family protein